VATTVVTPTFKDAQWLSDHAGGEGMVVSCYADTSPSGVRTLWREHLKNEVKRIDETLSGNPAALNAFHRNVATIEGVLSRRRLSARGVAIFAAFQRNLLQVYTLGSAVPNRLVVDEDPYLVPLLELLYRQRRYLVVQVAEHLFENVFQRDDTDRRTQRIGDNSYVTSARLQQPEDAQPRVFRADGDCRPHERSPVTFAGGEKLQQLLRVQHSAHRAVAENRQPRVSGRKGQLGQRLRQHGRIPDDGL